MPALNNHAPEKWQYPFHTQVKHQILSAYLKVWHAILASPTSRFGKLLYVDGYAGRGRYTDESKSPGSPIIGLDAAQNPPRNNATLDAVFIEKDNENYHSLKNEIAALNLPPWVNRPETINSSFESQVDNVLARIQAHDASFVFLDPFDIDMPFHAVQKVIRTKKTEVFINLMVETISRVYPDNPHLVDSLYGTHPWEEEFEKLLQKGIKRHIAYLEVYKNLLKREGIIYTIPYAVWHDTRKQVQYYLIHGSKVPLAMRRMKEEMVKVTKNRQAGHDNLAFEGPIDAHLRLFSTNPDLKELITMFFQSHPHTTFEGLLNDTYEDSGSSVEPDYKAILTELEDAGKLTVPPNPLRKGKRRGGFRLDDRLIFRG